MSLLRKLASDIETMRLGDIKIGQKAEITGYSLFISRTSRAKFLALGMIKKTVVEIMNTGLFGDPIEVKIRGYHLSLRKDEAKMIKVKLLSEKK